MSIEKLNLLSQTSLEQTPFTQICNSVTEHIKDNDAYRLYCYLSTKSREWTVIKEWTSKICGVGERKAKQCWSYLERAGLIQYMVARDAKGKFVKYDIRVLNGTQFNPEEPFHKSPKSKTAPLELSTQDDNHSHLENEESKVIHNLSGSEIKEIDHLSTEKPIQWCKNPPGGQSTRAGFAPLLNKDVLPNKDFEQNKEKSFCADAGQKMNNKTCPTSLPSSQPPRKPKADWRKENASRPPWADKKDIAAASKPQMDNEAAHIAKNEEFKRTPPPPAFREMMRKLKGAMATPA